MLSYIQAGYDWVQASFTKITYTKYLLGVITVGFTAAVLPFFRLIARAEGGTISKAADATYWVLSCIFGIGILVYPWWLATAKSPLYYSRLQYYGRIISIFILLLAGIQGIFNPENPFDKNHPRATSLAYQIISSLNIVAILGGLLIALPVLIRRDRLFKSNSQALFRFAWFFTLIMIVGMILNRCMGYNRIVSYSCVVIIFQFGVCDYLEAVERRRSNRVGKFDEAYIIIAGFVPFWIAFAVGGTLLEIVSQSGSTGTVFVYVSWRMIIYAFEYMAGEVGRKASRYSDGSVFSYSAIYTGATFANFIFLSVKWNSGTFWALLMITALNIIIVNGGLMIDMDYWFVDYFAVSEHWPRLYHLKVLYYEMCREMPKKLACKIAKCGSNPGPEVQLALIRSRAKFLQLNWVHNDIKMSSEFQALACACTAVGMEMVYSYYNVGADSITANSLDRRDILYILCVQVLFVFFAQAVARRRLRHKVSRLKREISQTVKALENTSSPIARRRSVSTGGYTGLPGLTRTNSAGSRRGSTSRTNIAGVKGEKSGGTTRRASQSPSVFATLRSLFSTSTYTSTSQCDEEQGGEQDEDCDADGDGLLISGNEVDEDALNAILGLCNLYAEGADELDGDTASTKQASPVRSKLPFASTNATSDTDGTPRGNRPFFGRPGPRIRFGALGPLGRANNSDNQDDAGSEDNWGEVQLTNSRQSMSHTGGGGAGGGFQRRVSGFLFGQPRRGSTRNTSTSSVRMQGYLNKRKPGTNSTYQRRFFVLTDRQLMWFANEEDVETHINRRKGAINIANIANLDRYDPTSLCIVNITVRGRVYILLASDRSLADEWYDMIQTTRDVHKIQDTPAAQDFEEQADEDDTAIGNTNLFPWFTGAVAAAQSRHAGRRAPPSARSEPRAFAPRQSLVGGLSSLLGYESTEVVGSHVSRATRRGHVSARLGIVSLFGGSNATTETEESAELLSEGWQADWDTTELPCKMGYIQKKGELNSNWQHRWFVMSSSGLLSWYEKAGQEVAQKSRGEIAVWEVSSIKPIDTDAPRLIEVLHIHGRVYELEACSELDANDWRQILEKWVFSARAAIEKYHLEQYGQQQSEDNHQHDSHQEEAREEHEHVPFLAQNPRRKTGFMHKRGGFNSDWRRRWFELDDCMMSWYERTGIDSKRQKLKGSLQLSEVLCIKACSHDAPCLVELMHMQGRTYELEAETTVEAEDWRLQLNLWLREAYNLTKAAQLGLNTAPVEPASQLLSADDSLPTTERTESTEIESAKLEHTKNKYFMYSKWGLKNKTARAKKDEPDAFGTLRLPPAQDLDLGSETKAQEGEETQASVNNCVSITPTTYAPSPVRSVGYVPQVGASTSSASSHRPFFSSANLFAQSQAISDIVRSNANSPVPDADTDDQSRASSVEERASSPSFSRLYATIAAAHRDDDSPVQLTENPGSSRAPRRMSSVEVSIEQRKRGFTNSIPVSQLRKQAKRQNILSAKTAVVSVPQSADNRRESELADTKFLHRMAKRHSSELVDNLQKRSYKDINAEFWDTHLWYLACVVCFVTLNVLYSTSYIMNRYK